MKAREGQGCGELLSESAAKGLMSGGSGDDQSWRRLGQDYTAYSALEKPRPIHDSTWCHLRRLALHGSWLLNGSRPGDSLQCTRKEAAQWTMLAILMLTV